MLLLCAVGVVAVPIMPSTMAHDAALFITLLQTAQGSIIREFFTQFEFYRIIRRTVNISCGL